MRLGTASEAGLKVDLVRAWLWDLWPWGFWAYREVSCQGEPRDIHSQPHARLYVDNSRHYLILAEVPQL